MITVSLTLSLIATTVCLDNSVSHGSVACHILWVFTWQV